MSKESYIRGFCKAAEAAGVDPNALAKFAAETKNEQPKYKTDGWAPHLTELEGRMKIPWGIFQGKNRAVGAVPNVNGLEWVTNDTPDHVERLYRILDPRRQAWADANTNATTKVLQILRDADYPRNTDIPHRAWGLLEDVWRDEMKRTTSAPPAQVSSPDKK